MEDCSCNSSVVYVGYALNPKKLRKSEVKTTGKTAEWAGGGLADIVEPSSIDPSSSNDGNDHIVFSPWDSTIPPASQTKFHVIIHKLTEDIEKEESKEKLLALERYLQTYPDTKIIDPIESVRKVTSRIRTIENLKYAQTTLGKKSPFSQPNFLHVTKEMSNPLIEELLQEKKISYPIICKPIEACGTPNSHSMVIVIRKEDIYMIPKPCIIQQYYNHNEILYKAYVIDEDVMIYRRPSLPNLFIQESFLKVPISSISPLQKPENVLNLHSLAFDSRYCYPKLENFINHGHYEYSTKVCDSPKIWGNSVSSDQGMIISMQEQSRAVENATSPFFPRQKKAKSDETIQSTVISSPNELDTMKTLLTFKEVEKHEELYELFVITANELKKTFGLTLFGFDVIVPTTSATTSILSSSSSSSSCSSSSQDLSEEFHHESMEGNETEENHSSNLNHHHHQQQRQPQPKLMIIDVNYFPSYKEVKDFPTKLKNYLRKKASC